MAMLDYDTSIARLSALRAEGLLQGTVDALVAVDIQPDLA